MQSVDRIMAILFALKDAPSGVSIAEVSGALGLPRSTVHRALQALMRYSVVAQDESSKKYRLGLGLLRLATGMLERNPLRLASLPHMEDLAEELGESVYMAVLEGGQTVCIAKVDGPQRLRYFVEVGRRMPFHCCASAKILLACMPPDRAERIMGALTMERFTAKTIVDKEEFAAHIAEARQKGYAVCDEELEPGVSAVAVPVLSACGSALASLSVIGPSQRFSADFSERAVESCLNTAAKIQGELEIETGLSAGQVG